MGLLERFRAAAVPLTVVGVVVVTFPITLHHVVALIPAGGVLS